MATIQINRTVSHLPEAVWAAFADFGGVHRFHPMVEHSPLHESAPQQGLGAERTCHFYDGNEVQERIVRWTDQQAMEIEVFGGSMPLRDANVRIELSPRGNGTTVQISMHYVPKFGVVGRLMDTLMIRRKLSSTLGLLLDALDEHLRTGKPIGPDFAPAKAA
ncbi:MAG: SRPBCC family protein [Deltaproteobacteria bacterium]|nr:SRPBCC family protein [Deltaproteobacteria bacterium]